MENPDGCGAFVIVCDHASNRVPESYGSLGLQSDILKTHIAWDPGALALSRRLSATLDAPLLWPDVSRLVIDCNREPAAPDLIVAEGDGRAVPGNRHLDPPERSQRLDAFHTPYHAAIDACLDRRLAAGLATALVAIHTFTPIWNGTRRPWPVGIVFDTDRRLADPMIAALRTDPGLMVGINQPYAPTDRVYYTLARHAGRRRLPALMIEIRNDEVAGEPGLNRWADRLGGILSALAPIASDAGHAAA